MRLFPSFQKTAMRGGVHPQDHKAETNALPIVPGPLPERLYLPLRQHAGADAVPVVKVGERVLKGQPIALAPSEVSAPVHASTSGRVVEIANIQAPHPSGLTAPAVVLEADGEDLWIDTKPLADIHDMAPEALAQRIADAGVVGLGGAIFPSAVKLKQGARHEVKTLVVNGAECEPYVTTDDLLMRHRPEQVVAGARLVQHVLRAYRVVFAVEDNKPQALAALRAAAALHGACEVVEVPARYPAGSAKQLAQLISGHEVPAAARSTSTGLLVHNVGTVYAIYEAVILGRPLISRVVTVGGGAVRQPRNLEARIGTLITELFDACGGLSKPPTRVLLGGPMMGQPLPSTQVPLIKGAAAVLALDASEVPAQNPAPCIRCGRCVQVCPMGLVPLEMAARLRVGDLAGADDYGLRDCILCGACAYACPAHIPLVQYFSNGRGAQQERRRMARKGERIQALMQVRKERLEREEAARAQTKAKKAAARKRRGATPEG